jgi:chaperone required for assembly of F1-ATPase
MTPEFVAMPETASVDQAIERLRSLEENHERTHYVYTLDDEGRLAGALSLRSLVLADTSTALSALAETDLITVTPEDDQELVADQISKYDLLAIPVIDETRKLLGIVTIDDAMDVLEEEHSEDMLIAGAGIRRRDAMTPGLGDLLLWLLRKHMWFFLWALLAIAVALANILPVMLPTLVFAPLVLLVAQEMVAYALNDLLEYSSDNVPKTSRLLGRNIAASLMTILTTGVIGTVFFIVLGSGIDNSSAYSYTPHPIQILLINGLLPAIFTSAVIITGGALVTLLAKQRLENNKSLSVVTTTLVSMLIALALLVSSHFLLVWMAPPLGLVG